ncbi:SulP family inorganic anion transporter [bacterium]|nr:SulP family inorganic anion transporter [bacterium]
MGVKAVPDWISGYNRKWLITDVIAGLTVAAILVPEGMAYAQVAGVAAEVAFYTIPPALVLYALFGSSRQLVVATSGAIAVLSATIVGSIVEGSSEEYIAYSAALAMFAGVIAVLCGVLKLGRIAQFFSESVLTGFVFGLALVISIKQVPKIIGIESTEGNFFERLWDILRHLGDADRASVVVGVSTIVVMVLIERFADKVPAALVVLIGGIIAGTVFDLADEGVEVLGEVPAGLAGPALPDFAAADIGMLILGGLAITLVAFAEEVGPANEFASKHRYETDGNQELIGLGAANFGAGLFQGFPVGSSLSTSAANDGAGARSPLSLIVAAFAVVVVALFLTGTLENLPEPTLAAIVIVAISGMMKVPQMKRLWRINRLDFLLAVTALFGVLLFDTLVGLGLAVLVSLGLVIWQASSGRLSPLGRKPGSGMFVATDEYPEAATVDGLLILRAEAPMFFANSASIRAGVKQAAAASETPIVAVVLDLASSFKIDVPGCDNLRELAEDLARDDIHLGLTRVRSSMKPILQDTGVIDAVGADRIFTSNGAAVAAFASKTERAPDPDVVAAEATAALSELADLLDDDDVSRRLRRAIDALDADTE